MRRYVGFFVRCFAVATVGALGLAGLSWFAKQKQIEAAASVTATEASKVPALGTALVLGTSPLVGGGRPNRPFHFRLDATAALWHAGKVKYVIASGNRTGVYDEPTAMRQGLIERGVPAEAIYRDYAGFRTYDSVARARRIFGQTKLVVVSQESHVPRAIYLARAMGIEVWGLVALDIQRPFQLFSFLRINGSALLAHYDVWRGKPPRQGGDPIAIGVDPPN